jgi:serine protease Do
MHRLTLLGIGVLLFVAVGCSSTDGGNQTGILSRGNSTAGKSPDFVSLAKKLQPVVVNVSVTQKVAAKKFGAPPQQGEDQDALNDLLQKFFGVPPPSQGSPGSPQRDLASGFIIGSEGLILTNYHVVDNAEKIVVKLADNREFPGQVVGKDPRTDLAVIKIDTKENLPTAQLGDSDGLEVGEWVMAVGNPFGLDNSVTSGIVSAKGRHIGAGPYDNFIQTDAKINPGNSGGPLVNSRGQVVGINMAILSQTGTNTGVGFATPINLVKEVLPELKTTGKVTRGWMGVAVQAITPEIAEALDMDKPRGALVADVVRGGPADRSGIKVRDVITEYDGKEIKEANDFPILVARTAVEKQVRVKVLRDEKEIPLSVTIGELNEDQIGATKRKAG